MKKCLIYIFAILLCITLAGCGGNNITVDDNSNNSNNSNNGGSDMSGKSYTVGEDIKIEDISEFYYTEEEINYDAYYQRYHFYVDNGTYRFFHETRERKDDYGPCTEADTTLTGDYELTDDEWKEFFTYIEGGKVSVRGEDITSGDSGPWTYLYWKNDNDECQEYKFRSYDVQRSFEKFCLSLVSEYASDTDASGD